MKNTKKNKTNNANEEAMGEASDCQTITREARTSRRWTDLAREYWQAGYRSEAGDVESVAGYVRRVLEQMELEEAGELLSLL